VDYEIRGNVFDPKIQLGKERMIRTSEDSKIITVALEQSIQPSAQNN
jgi:hypothetical protein